MVRPADLRYALALAQPELEEAYRTAQIPPLAPGTIPRFRAGELLDAMLARFRDRPGGEETFRFLVDSAWLSQHVVGISTAHIERAGPFDPLATFQLLNESTPFVPITQGKQLLKVIDRVGVATEIARTVVERRLGRP
jgi:hypothetical protein